MAEDREVDLLIAGAGPAGMAAALVAALEGLDVLLCEKSGQVGGTGSTSAGTLWIPGNRQSRAAGFDDSAADADRYLDALIGRDTNRALRDAFLQTGPDGDRLSQQPHRREIPAVRSASRLPQQHARRRFRRTRHRPATVRRPPAGRCLRTRAPAHPGVHGARRHDGRQGRHSALAQPLSVAVANFIYAAKLFLRYLADRLRYPRGTRLMMGNALVGRLFYSLRQRDVPILFDARDRRL